MEFYSLQEQQRLLSEGGNAPDATTELFSLLASLCANASAQNSEVALECLLLNEFQLMDEKIDEVAVGLDTLFQIFAGSLIFIMQGGFGMLEAGSVRAKNVKDILLKNLLDACTTAIIYFICGYAFQFGDSPGNDDNNHTTSFIGTTGFFASGLETAKDYSTFFSFYGFAATSTTIVACAVAERCQIVAYILYSIFLAGFVYPVVARSIWSPAGFLSAVLPPGGDAASSLFLGVGVIDFAGSGVVHITGGATALVAVFMLGPRLGRFHDMNGNPLDTPHKFQQHSTALQVLGTFLLWFGWYGFNAGSAITISNGDSSIVASLCTVTSTLAAASGGIVGLYFDTWMEYRKTFEISYDTVGALNGALSGLVAITAGCSVVAPWASVLIGAVAGVLYVLTEQLLVKLRLDDVVSAVPVHLANGIWGLLAVGLFAEQERLEIAGYPSFEHKGMFYSWGDGSGDAARLLAQFVAILWIVGWTMAMAIPFFFVLNLCDLFRVLPGVELKGLDAVNHGGIAYNLDISRHSAAHYTGATRSRPSLAPTTVQENSESTDAAVGGGNNNTDSVNGSSIERAIRDNQANDGDGRGVEMVSPSQPAAEQSGLTISAADAEGIPTAVVTVQQQI